MLVEPVIAHPTDDNWSMHRFHQAIETAAPCRSRCRPLACVPCAWEQSRLCAASLDRGHRQTVHADVAIIASGRVLRRSSLVQSKYADATASHILCSDFNGCKQTQERANHRCTVIAASSSAEPKVPTSNRPAADCSERLFTRVQTVALYNKTSQSTASHTGVTIERSADLK